jgi:hypothetical protein
MEPVAWIARGTQLVVVTVGMTGAKHTGNDSLVGHASLARAQCVAIPSPK